MKTTPIRASVRRLSVSVLVALVLTAGTILPSAEPTDAAQTLTVKAGSGEPGFAVNEYLPGLVRINPGDTVHWETDWFEPHTVTFGQPAGDPTIPTHPAGGIIDYDGSEFISSGVVFGPTDDLIDIRFTTPGEYPYSCVLHPTQNGVIVVVESNSVTSQTTADARAAAEYDSAIITLKAVAASLEGVPTPTEALGENTQHSVRAGGESFSGDVMQFFQSSITVDAGDTVRWQNPNGAPHNVVFGPPQQADPFEFAGSDMADGWDGSGGIQSPMLGQFFGGITEWPVKFTTPGTYAYICILHADQGMIGEIQVVLAPTPEPTATAPNTPTPSPSVVPKPPQTGTGAEPATGQGDTLFILLTGMLAVMTGLATAGWKTVSKATR